MTAKKDHPLYRAYENMKARVNNRNYPTYKHYGGRGIKICERWLGKEGFSNFIKDMGNKPDRTYSIDRIDNDGDYEPSNCKWSTQTEQVNNQRLRHDNKSGFKGVYWRERDKRWIAQVRLNGKTIYLGSFLNKEAAIDVRVKHNEAGELTHE